MIWLCSDRASFVPGQAIALDGGLRSTVASSATGPNAGCLTNWTVSFGGAREASPSAIVMPLRINAARVAAMRPTAGVPAIGNRPFQHAASARQELRVAIEETRLRRRGLHWWQP